jgi:hypothetical protein
VPRYEACIQVHLILNQLASVPYYVRSTAVLKAWAEYHWDGPSVYKEFLKDSNHQDPCFNLLCERYLMAIYQHLRDAQEMYNAIHTEKPQVVAPAPVVRDVIAAAARQLGVKPHVFRQQALARNEIVYSGVSKGQKRPQHLANGQPAKRSSSRPQTRDICPMGSRGEESERNLPPNLNFHAMAQAVGLPARYLNQCIIMAKQGLCF